MNWIEIKAKGDIGNDSIEYFPKGTKWMGMAKLNDSSVIIYGGEYVFGYAYGDTWIYHINQNKWEFITGYPPSYGRSGHMMTDIIDGLVYFCGGSPEYNRRVENWYFDKEIRRWVEITDMKNNFITQFIERAAFVRISEGIAVLFGGRTSEAQTEEGWYDSTWVLNYREKYWLKLEIPFRPSDRLNAKMARIDENKAILFGGGSIQNPKPEDTWLFALDSIPTSAEVIDKNIDKIEVIRQVSDDEILIDYTIDNTNKIEIKILNMQGNILYNHAKDGNGIIEQRDIIRLNNLSSGVYFIWISSAEHNLFDKFVFVR